MPAIAALPEEPDSVESSPRFERSGSIAIAASGAVLAAISLGWIPGLRYQWGLNLWSYLPGWLVACLAAGVLSLCFARVRAPLLRALSRLQDDLVDLPRPLLALLLFATAVGLLYQLRERWMYGDSHLIVMWALQGQLFAIPDLGATFVTQCLLRLAVGLGTDPGRNLQLFAVVMGAVALLLLRGAARHVSREYAAAVVLLVGGGGLMRVFAGHIEVYATLLPAVVGYLWAALAHLHGRAAWWVPCLALGVAVWAHLSAVLLVPSLVALAWGISTERSALQRLLVASRHVAVASLPSLLFLGLIALAADPAEIFERQLPKLLDILGQSEQAEGGTRLWVRGWGGAPSVGTDVVFLSPAHLKYLVNAALLLAPAGMLAALAMLAWRPRALLGDPQARFLAALTVPLVAYSLALRPMWGPFDWDLFAITSLCVAFLGAHLVVTQLPRHARPSVLLWLVGFQLLFTGIPFLAMNAVDLHPAGPFASFDMLTLDIMGPLAKPNPAIAPWL